MPKRHNKKPVIEVFSVSTETEITLPFVNEGIKAGFPSPAQDYLDQSIDLNKELLKHPSSTFLARVSGDSMEGACLFDNDILIVDKSLEAKDNDIIVCFIDGEFTIKYYKKISANEIYLMPANDKYKPIKLTPDNNVIMWGVVTYSILNHHLRKNVRPR